MYLELGAGRQTMSHLLPNYLGRLLIGQSNKMLVSQMFIRGPFDKFELRDQDRLPG